MMFSYLGQRWRGEAYVGVVLKKRRLLELILIKRMYMVNMMILSKKDEEDPELEIEIFLQSDFKMISFCKILDFMFLD